MIGIFTFMLGLGGWCLYVDRYVVAAVFIFLAFVTLQLMNKGN